MGDVPVHVTLAAGEGEWHKLREDWRQRSREEKTALFWVGRMDDAIQRATDEVFRSNEILARKERNAVTRDETALVSEEKKKRGDKLLPELRRLLRSALLDGTVFFRGNDRSPDKGVSEVAKACSGILSKVLPEVFDRFQDAAARVAAKDLDSLLKTESLHGLPGAQVLAHALEQVRLIRSGTDDNAIQTFNASFGAVKEAIKREAELRAALTTPGLHDLARGRDAAGRMWPFLKDDADLPASLAADAADLGDVLQKETFFRQLPRIDQLAKKVETAYEARFQAAVVSRRAAYEAAVAQIHAAPEWSQLNEEQQHKVAAPLADPAKTDPPAKASIWQIRAETDACPARLAAVMAEMLQMVDGNRIARVKFSSYFNGGIDTTEQLDGALQGPRDECERLIGEGKKVLVQ